MCNFKCKKSIRYIHIYDEAFKSKDKSSWLKYIINYLNFCCPRRRILTIQILSKAVHTQSIFSNIDADAFEQLVNAVKSTQKERLQKLRKIQNKTLNHMYKPNGTMYWKNLHNLNILEKKIKNETTFSCI